MNVSNVISVQVKMYLENSYNYCPSLTIKPSVYPDKIVNCLESFQYGIVISVMNDNNTM